MGHSYLRHEFAHAEMESKGIEPSSLTAFKTAISETGGGKSGAPADANDPDLAEVVKAWPELSEDTRTAIKAQIETDKAEKK